jgi:hypothetical protein
MPPTTGHLLNQAASPRSRTAGTCLARCSLTHIAVGLGPAALPCVASRAGWDCAGGGADRRSAKNAHRPMDQSREAHLAAWPLHSPEGACPRRRFRTWDNRGSQGIRSQGIAIRPSSSYTSGCLMPLTCGFGTPGRTRTWNLRIRSEPRPVRLVPSWRIAAGRVGSAVRQVASRPAPSQRPDCQRDRQHRRGNHQSVAWRVVSPGIKLQVHPASCHSPHQPPFAEQGKHETSTPSPTTMPTPALVVGTPAC